MSILVVFDEFVVTGTAFADAKTPGDVNVAPGHAPDVPATKAHTRL